MKSPQRNFVVEYKGNRRLQKTSKQSIWGDTDFKALIREAGENAPHLFNSEEAPVAQVTNDGAFAPEQASPPKICPDAVAAMSSPQAGAQVVASANEDLAGFAEIDKGATGDLVDQCPGADAADKQLQATTEAVPRTVEARDDDAAAKQQLSEPISLQELDALEAENKRLKRLVAERLRLQNAQMRQMLHRFLVA